MQERATETAAQVQAAGRLTAAADMDIQEGQMDLRTWESEQTGRGIDLRRRIQGVFTLFPTLEQTCMFLRGWLDE